MKQITIRTADEKTYYINVDGIETLRDFQTELEQSCDIPIKQQRLFHNGKPLLTDTDYQTCKGHPTPNIALSILSPTSTGGARVEHDLPTPDKSLTMKKFEECWILMLNCEACISACQNGLTAEEREKINEPNGLTVEHSGRPCAADLGNLTGKIAGIYESHGKIMSEVGQQLNQNNSTGKLLLQFCF